MKSKATLFDFLRKDKGVYTVWMLSGGKYLNLSI